MSDSNATPEPVPVEDAEVSLVPARNMADVRKGIQAYRRGDAIVYTVRGEPGKVIELVDELDRHGVGEVMAAVWHRADDVAGPEEDIADAEQVDPDIEPADE